MTTTHDCARCASGCSRARYETVDSTCRCEDCHSAPVMLTPPTLEERVRAHRELADYAHLMYSRRMSTRRDYLHELRTELHAAWDEGTLCPVCDQFVKVYQRTIHATMARALIALYRECGGDERWMHLATVAGPACEGGKLRYWGLLEEDSEIREDGGRSGWWRLTEGGRKFALGTMTVPKYAEIYDGELRRLHGPEISIVTALGTKFDYRELMGT